MTDTDTSVPILVFLDLSVLDLGPMYATERSQTSDVRRASSLNAPYPRGGAYKGHVDVFMDRMLPFRTWKSKNVRKMLNGISAVAVIISISVFLASTKIDHGVVDEDLGFDF